MKIIFTCFDLRAKNWEKTTLVEDVFLTRERWLTADKKRREPSTSFGRVFNFKLGRFVKYRKNFSRHKQPILELKTMPGICPVGYSLFKVFQCLPKIKVT
jgi:hypothetical protein